MGARGIGGHVETQGTGTIVTQSTPPTSTPPSTPNVTCNTELKQNFWGVQADRTLASSISAATAERLLRALPRGTENEGRREERSVVRKFEAPFVGVYTTASKGNFFSDFMTRVDFYQMTLDNPTAGLFNQD